MQGRHLESSVPVVAVSPAVSVSEALARWRAGVALDGVEVLRSGLLEVLATVPDPRAARGKRYPLVGLLAIAILAVAAGMRGYAGFASWARTAPDDVLSQLGIRFRRPSEKTFRRVLSSLNAADLDRRLGAYFTGLAAAAQPDPCGLVAVSLDGKTARGALRGTATGTHLVAVFAHHARLILGQLAVAAKSNEIPCVRAVLKSLPRLPMMVIMDAMHTQVRTARLIRMTLRSHYLLVVKSNQPGLLSRIKAMPWGEVPVTATDDDRGHGRVEKRTLQSLTTARGIGFPYVKQVVRITRERLIIATGRHSVEVVYAICSLPFEQARPAAIATWLRHHWGIENSVHWVRDVTFDEDRSTVRTGNGPQVMATLRNTALNLHRLDGATNIAEACRETAFTPDRRINLLNPQNQRSHAC
jgi:predicted transposase YbfD/YdcC